MSTTLEKKRAVERAEDLVRKALEHTELAHWGLDDATEAEQLPRLCKQAIERAMCPVHEARHLLKDLLEDLEEQADVLRVAAELERGDLADRVEQVERAERIPTPSEELDPELLLGGGIRGTVRSGEGARGGEGSC